MTLRELKRLSVSIVSSYVGKPGRLLVQYNIFFALQLQRCTFPLKHHSVSALLEDQVVPFLASALAKNNNCYDKAKVMLALCLKPCT